MYDTSVKTRAIDRLVSRTTISRQISMSIGVVESRREKDKRGFWPRGQNCRFFYSPSYEWSKRQSLRVQREIGLSNRLPSSRAGVERSRKRSARQASKKEKVLHVLLLPFLSFLRPLSLAPSAYSFLLTDISPVIKSRAIFIESLWNTRYPVSFDRSPRYRLSPSPSGTDIKPDGR